MTTFEHDALLYEGQDAFVEHMLPFVRGGIQRGESVLAVTSPKNVEALRDVLATDAPLIDWSDSSDWYSSPGQAFSRYADYVAAKAGQCRVRVIGEPVWPVGTGTAVQEWARYESVLNIAFAEAAAWIVCPYDVSSLPDAILEHARQTHPMLHARGRRMAHEGYVEPRAFWASLDEATPFTPALSALQLPVTPDLASLRAAVAGEAATAGVSAARIPELLVAVHELVINALIHGGGDAMLQTWVAEGDFVCEISDTGPGLVERHVGYGVPSPDETRGRGFWLARQLCDLVEVRSGSEGTRVRVHVRRA